MGAEQHKKSVQEKKFEREESKNKKNNDNNNNNMSSLGYAQRLAWKEDVGGTLSLIHI